MQLHNYSHAFQTDEACSDALAPHRDDPQLRALLEAWAQLGVAQRSAFIGVIRELQSTSSLIDENVSDLSRSFSVIVENSKKQSVYIRDIVEAATTITERPANSRSPTSFGTWTTRWQAALPRSSCSPGMHAHADGA
ncbi:hypothetical protein E6W36_07875 [Hankyongella ginsenosidimutans]|uniref:Uncharacterized protein n=1 Tax=Hankyongella ginsenosidimutans TaxID=1763828 RepID=A0A4D7C336_9SPHN|nr:hypothetical protein [Hankyongella ginsenosidimutans]QCI79491.1 hypothetical protein E6W36_07875 [Hankyongella ginsenosidimutans]